MNLEIKVMNSVKLLKKNTPERDRARELAFNAQSKREHTMVGNNVTQITFHSLEGELRKI